MQSIPNFLQEESATYNARSALLLEMGVLAKNFSQATKTARTVKFYSPCFGLEPELARQPTTSTHQYGPVTATPNRIDWELVHRTVDVLYTQLEGPLADAIAILENQELDPKDEAAPLDWRPS